MTLRYRLPKRDSIIWKGLAGFLIVLIVALLATLPTLYAVTFLSVDPTFCLHYKTSSGTGMKFVRVDYQEPAGLEGDVIITELLRIKYDTNDGHKIVEKVLKVVDNDDPRQVSVCFDLTRGNTVRQECQSYKLTPKQPDIGSTQSGSSNLPAHTTTAASGTVTCEIVAFPWKIRTNACIAPKVGLGRATLSYIDSESLLPQSPDSIEVQDWTCLIVRKEGEKDYAPECFRGTGDAEHRFKVAHPDAVGELDVVIRSTSKQFKDSRGGCLPLSVPVKLCADCIRSL